MFTLNGTGVRNSIASVPVRFWHQTCDKTISFSEAAGLQNCGRGAGCLHLHPHFLCRGLRLGKVKELVQVHEAEKEEKQGLSPVSLAQGLRGASLA